MTDTLTGDDKIRAYVFGHMTASDRAAFEAEMVADQQLAAEVALATGARAAFAAEDAAQQTATANGWKRLERELTPKTPIAANDNRPVWYGWAQTAAAVVVAVGLWQTFAVPQLTQQDATGFVPVTVATDLPTLQVVFADDAEIGDVIALLDRLGGVIVDGPSAIGLFRVSFTDEALRDAALRQLELETALVSDAMLN